MALNTNDLNKPLALQQSLSKYLKDFIRSPANFGPADKMFSNLMNRPAFSLGPSGQMMDPNQNQSLFANNFLQDRSGIATQNLQDKTQSAGLLTKLGGSIGNIANTIPFLEAQNITNGSGGGSGGAGGMGMFGSLMSR